LPITTEMPIQQATAALADASRQAAAVVVGNRGLGGFTGCSSAPSVVQLAAHAASPVVVVRRTDRPDGPEAGRVTVGVDGSHDAERALQFAFEQASFRGTGLTAVHTYLWPTSTGPGDLLPLVYDQDNLRDEERRALAESVTGWASKYPDVDVRNSTVRGRASAVLTELSAGAERPKMPARQREEPAPGPMHRVSGSTRQRLVRIAARTRIARRRHRRLASSVGMSVRSARPSG
jgi:nucleotide-binding universal stress UspA family protein